MKPEIKRGLGALAVTFFLMLGLGLYLNITTPNATPPAVTSTTEADVDAAIAKRNAERLEEAQKEGLIAPTPSAETAQDKEAKKETDKMWKAAYIVATLHDSMRNPDSFKLSKAFITDDGSVCVTYRAQNGFGGMNVEQLVVNPKGRSASSESGDLVGMWNRYCANKTGCDKTYEVNLLIGLTGR